MMESKSNLPELPLGWTWTTIGEIAETTSGGTPSRKMPEYYTGTIPWVKSGELNDSLITSAEEHITEEVIRNSIAKVFPRNTTLVALYGATVGKIAILGIDAATNQAICAIFPKANAFIPKFMAYWLRFKRQSLIELSIGGAQPNISQGIIRSFIIPLAPPPEQHRIVSRIEELFSRLNAGVEALQKAKALLRRYRQAVLKAAVEGGLTVEWRKAHPEVETAEKLLEEIEKKQLKGERRRYRNDLSTNAFNLPELPSGCKWTRLGNITDLTSGKAFKKKEYSEQGVRLFQIANVSFGKIIWDNVVYMPSEYLKIFPNLNLNTGDILMALNRPLLNGDLKIGKLGENDVPAILYQRVGRFDFYEDSISPYFIYYARSPIFINMLKESLQGVDQPFINKPNLLNLSISLPPQEEQNHIVSEIEKHLSVAYNVENTIEVRLEQVSCLHQSILKRAFEGRLVPQNPSDEPASMLLERIRDERAKQAPRKSKKNGRNSTKQIELIQ